MQNSCNVASTYSNSSDDMEAMAYGINIIQDRTEAILNNNVCDEVYRILNLSKDEVYTPSSVLSI